MMRQIGHIAIAAALAAAQAWGWGDKGHRIIGALAEIQLRSAHPEAMERLEKLMGAPVSLADLATCADSIRGFVRDHAAHKPAHIPKNCLVSEQEALADFADTGNWHFINIPIPADLNTGAHVQSALDVACAKRSPCVTQQLHRFFDELKGKNNTPKKRARALMFLIHFLGDLHQPLHAVAREEDQGGNLVFVKFDNRVQKLHGVWDGAVLNNIRSLEAPFEDNMEERDVILHLHARKLAMPGVGFLPEEWAWESFDAARTVVYAGLPKKKNNENAPIKLNTKKYQDKAGPVVERQLWAAGMRLAEAIRVAMAE